MHRIVGIGVKYGKGLARKVAITELGKSVDCRRLCVSGRLCVSIGGLCRDGTVIGALAAGGLFLAIYYLAIWVLKKEGLGFGDVKLAFAAGLLLGWQKMLFALLIASVAASAVLLILRKKRGDAADTEYPFGPFLAAGFAIALLFGDAAISYYLSLFSL